MNEINNSKIIYNIVHVVNLENLNYEIVSSIAIISRLSNCEEFLFILVLASGVMIL